MNRQIWRSPSAAATRRWSRGQTASGPKLASRIVNELKDKVGALAGIGGGAKLMSAASGSHASDAMSALANLGFKPGEAGSAVAQAVEELGPDATLDALVRLALKRAAK